MSFLLDTCTVSAHICRPAELQTRFVQYSGSLYISSVALAELYVLAYRLDDPTARLEAIDEMIRDEISVMEFDLNCASVAGRLRADLLRRGAGVPPIDLFMGAVAVAYDMTLVTHNTVDFLPIPAFGSSTG